MYTKTLLIRDTILVVACYQIVSWKNSHHHYTPYTIHHTPYTINKITITTSTMRTDMNPFEFRFVPIGSVGKVLQLPVFSVIRFIIHEEIVAVAYAAERIYERSGS